MVNLLKTPLTYAEVALHNTIDDLFIVIRDNIYDVTEFKNEHPGGVFRLLQQAGQDATEAFEWNPHSENAREILKDLKVGTLRRRVG
ncbi:cytochrome b5 B [Lepidopterella palustris CBS 459.81]|uniref:Cytochrome b5 B n=1 Tax=Lepidopterella palustris CBS 459.81 TaxID=1314670 RepID=A0A8E2DZM1_9PEZI|nr:cytochrome b5 B [Lepidopterella palustris CBS 459.81]